MQFTNPGVCRDCEVCPAGEFIPDCRYMNKGSCRACTTCNASEYTLADCTGTEDRVCASCEDLPLCAPGFFREGCGGGAEGQCVPCHATQPGFFRVECGASGETAGGLVVREPGYPLSGGHAVECEACEPEHFRNGCGGADTPLQPGICQRCEDCGRGNWRDGCGTASSAVISPGVCKPCQVCGDNLFVVGCEYLSPGECRDCMQCDATQYTVRECSNEADRICGACTALPACPEGEYREGCGLGNEGQCTACPVPPVGFYHVECGGLNAGRDVRCGECAEGEFNYNCKGNNEGSCEACGACSAGEYRLNCGTWIDPGHCEPCPECPGGHYLIGCGGMSAGSCTPCYVCAHDEYETMPCSNRQNRECSKCAQLPPCEVGQYRADCGFGSEGECRICGECPPGSIRQGCGGDQPGTCAACGECPEGQFRFGCADGQPGECRDCADCPDGSYRVGCKGQEEGHCEPCSQCGEHEYEGRVCSGTGLQQHDRQCLTCDSLTCAPGSYRKGCGNNPEGICTLCPDTCGEGQFRVGCENEQEGVCGPCALDCPEDQYRKGCQYLDPGQCTDCAVCPEGYFSKGCGGLHAGACLACDSLPCPPNMERTQCGGKSEGYCDQIWLSYTPPPEPILWAEWLTDNPTPECIDNGGNDIPGVTRNFHMPNSLLRLGACRQATASGSYTLKATGKWMVNFYVGIPTFDSKPGAVAPAAYPMQDEGKPDPSDTLEVTLCGGKAGDICVTQTFENKLDGGFEDNKHVFYHTIDSMETTTLHFKFTWKSSNIKDHLHLFASTGTAVFLGDKLPISKAVAYAESHLAGLGEGEGNLEGAIENAIDGNKLAPKKNVKTGYKIHRKTIRLALPDREADFQMFVGSSKLYEPTVQKGAYESVIAAGKYACQASFPGFYTAFDPVCVVDGSKDRKHSMVLCPYLNPGHGRFILTWGEKPQDMDLYLDAPDGQGGRCTVMWKRANKFCQQVGKSREAARIHLDLDVTDGYGPETITVEGFVPGEYLLRVKVSCVRTHFEQLEATTVCAFVCASPSNTTSLFLCCVGFCPDLTRTCMQHYQGSSCVDRRTNFDKCLADSGAMVSFYMDDRQFRFEISKGHGYTAGIQV